MRGTVRYGSPQPVVLATSEIKQGGATTADIVTTRPRRGARVGEGTVAMSVSGRPVFVLRGAQASHRDMRPGQQGAGRAAAGGGPAAAWASSRDPIDGRYDGETAAAVASWYESEGWEPFGSTDAQLDALRTARANAAQARDAYLQSLSHDQDDAGRASRPGTSPRPASTSRRPATTSTRRSTPLPHRAAASRWRWRTSAGTTRSPPPTSRSSARRVNKARDAQLDAQRTLAEAPPGTSPSELAALQAAVRQAGDDVTVAQEDLNASVASADATREAGRSAVAAAKADRARALRALPTARRQVRARRAAAARAHDTRRHLPSEARQPRPRSRRPTAPPATWRDSPARWASRCRPTRSSSSPPCRSAWTPCGCAAATACRAA